MEAHGIPVNEMPEMATIDKVGNTIAVKHARGYFASKVNLPGALSQDLAQKMAIANNRA